MIKATIFHHYLGQEATLTQTNYSTLATTQHYGTIVGVENRLITILKTDGTHVSGPIDNLRLRNPNKFLKRV